MKEYDPLPDASDDEEKLEYEPLFESPSPQLEEGSIAPNIKINIVGGLRTSLAALTEDAPVLLNFIKGTWCPFCQAHMRGLTQWLASLKDRHVNVIVISSELEDVIKAWTRYNAVTFSFANLPNRDDFLLFGVNIADHDFPRPATFLIETGLKVRMAHYGRRNRKNLKISV